MHKTAMILFLMLIGGVAVAAEPPPATRPVLHADGFDKTITKKLEMQYLVYLPPDYGKGARSPLLICLHGSGECGHDLKKVEHLPLAILKANPDLPCVIVAPQLHSELEGWTVEQLDTLLDEVLAKYGVDPDRVYALGISWGAYGVWDWGTHSPQRLAAIVPISGEPNTDLAGRMKHLPVWAFHGALDKEVWPHEDQKMIGLLAKMGDEAKLTMYEDLRHNAWSRALEDPQLYPWLLRHRRGGSATRPALTATQP